MGRWHRNLCVCGECWPNSSKFFPDGDDEGAFIVRALDARGKPLFELAPYGTAQLFTLVVHDFCVPGFLDGVVISQASTAKV